MWDQLIAIKQHRETRLRNQIVHAHKEIDALQAQIKELDTQRINVINTWQTRSEEQSVQHEEELNAFRRELSGYASEEIRLKKQRVRLRTEVLGLKQRIHEWNKQLRQCLVKQEKLRLLRDEMGDSHVFTS